MDANLDEKLYVPDMDHIRELVFIADLTIRQRAGPYVNDLLQIPKYRMALGANVISRSDLEYLALFEQTRDLLYQPRENIGEDIIAAFGVLTGMTGEAAFDRFGEIENRVSDHHNTLQAHFSEHANRFLDTYRM